MLKKLIYYHFFTNFTYFIGRTSLLGSPHHLHHSHHQHLTSLLSSIVAYQPGSDMKYVQSGGDTLSDFVTLVCQEAQNAQQVEWEGHVCFLGVWKLNGKFHAIHRLQGKTKLIIIYRQKIYQYLYALLPNKIK